MDERLDDVLENAEDIDGEIALSYDILTLISDDGEEYQFELLDRAEMDGAEYVAMMPIDEEHAGEDEDEEVDGELVFMKAIQDGDEEFLESIDDDAEYERISELFTERLSEFFDIE